MIRQYLIRLDDACPTMDAAKWQHIENIFDKYGIKPMVGVIPHNEDSQQEITPIDKDFWKKVHLWESKGWAIALHGYNHCYNSNEGLKGLNPMWSRSEFAGLSLEEQREKIRKGVAIMRDHGINPLYFFAPGHTFDDNTLNALNEESDIKIISDTIANKPYLYNGFIFIPQVGGHCTKIRIPGIWTFCLHPNTMNDESIAQTEDFIKAHKRHFISFDQLDIKSVDNKDLFSCFLSWMYFFLRRIRRIK